MVKRPKRPRDPNQLAKFVVDAATGETEILPGYAQRGAGEEGRGKGRSGEGKSPDARPAFENCSFSGASPLEEVRLGHFIFILIFIFFFRHIGGLPPFYVRAEVKLHLDWLQIRMLRIPTVGIVN